jgi:Fic family protein
MTIERDIIPKLGRGSKQGSNLLNGLFSQPVVTVKDVQTITGLTTPAANHLVQALVEADVLIETTGYKRNRAFNFEKYLKLFK